MKINYEYGRKACRRPIEIRVYNGCCFYVVFNQSPFLILILHEIEIIIPVEFFFQK